MEKTKLCFQNFYNICVFYNRKFSLSHSSKPFRIHISLQNKVFNLIKYDEEKIIMKQLIDFHIKTWNHDYQIRN